MEMTRSQEAVQRVQAGESASAVAREMGLSRDAIYKEMRRQSARAEKAAAAQAALERIKRADAARLQKLFADDLATKRAAIEQLPRSNAPNGAQWVDLAEVLRVLHP